MLGLSFGILSLIIGAELITKGSRDALDFLGLKDSLLGFALIAALASSPEFFITFFASALGMTKFILFLVGASFVIQMTFMLGTVSFIKGFECFEGVGKLFNYILWINFLLLLISLDGVIDFFDSAMILVIYLVHLITLSTRAEAPIKNPLKLMASGTGGLLKLVAGLIIILMGVSYAVKGAIDFITPLGVNVAAAGIMLAFIILFSKSTYAYVASSKGRSKQALFHIIEGALFTLSVPLAFAAMISPLKVNFVMFSMSLGISLIALALFRDGCFSRRRAILMFLSGLPFIYFLKVIV